ncbi:LysR family transcriptional regulator [Amphritea sp. 2_MG-2023]|uniref:LysR family transcriptional regulator n=1 Tax=Amphritea TaxID=515417 RepID=UPI001C079A15|nr:MULTISPECIES: LysR family transcriptional regulator [Amphritea]MBU2966767.1 LysR family transcriptional regulator [Amphritea atlantica]MDO6418966.1 LysR family transcriptional regulator [Amphritea sp. 2_MG-2023]
MITFKQIEALFWISELGNFAAAAEKLHTTQSAISKRINELETTFGMSVFDRSRRNARLTEKGSELLLMAKDLIEMRDEMLERMANPQVLHKRFRIGVTELTALTWLPKLVKLIEENYPRLILEPQVELSSVLFDKMSDDSLDFIIVPDIHEDARFKVQPLGSVENAWMCTPDYTDIQAPIALQDIAQFNVLMQGARSGTGLIYDRWFSQNKVQASQALISSNLVAQLGLTLSGFGITYLPLKAMNSLIEQGQLRTLDIHPKLPQVRYAAIYRADRDSRLYTDVADYAKQACDFSRFLLNVF